MDEIPFIVPPLAEQQAIAAYLDAKCGKVDSLVAELDQQVSDLSDLKKSEISRVVTKGLDPNVSLKDSGIEWIGMIPKNWIVVPLKRTGFFENGLTYSPSDVCDDDGVLVLRSSNIQNSELSFEDNVYVSKAPSELLVKKGDIIVCSRNGSAALIGKCAQIKEDIHASFGAFMMRYSPNINVRFSFYAFQNAMGMNRSLYTTSTINQLTKGVISMISLAIPNEQEQQAIADYLDAYCSKIDATISEIKSQIADLKLYKQSIISEAVTGKIRVTD